MSGRARIAVLALCALLLASGCRSTDGSVRYDVSYRGNDSVGDSALDDVIVDNLADFERHGHRESAIDDAAFAIQDHYRSRGWRDATAGYDLRTDEDGTLQAVIEVEEGVRTELGHIAFRGGTVFPTDELVELVRGPSEGLFDRTRWFVDGDVRAAADEITRLYLSRGYLQARVSEPDIAFRDDGKVADLLYTIDEGIRFQIAELEIVGDPVLPEGDLRDALPFEVGDPYSPNADRLARAALLEFYGAAGHPDATVAVSRSVDEVTGDVRLRLEVSGGIHVTVSEVRVEGNEHTRTSFIARRVTAPIGEPFTPERERQSFRRLFGTGIFSRISLELVGDGPERPLVVRVEEALAKEVFVEPGWGSYELLRLKAGYRNRNLFGTGRGFRAEGIASFRHLEAEVGVNDPFLFGSEVFADVSLSALRREEPSFVRLSTGLDVDLARRWAEDWETGISYQFRRSAAEDVDITDPAALAALDDVDISAIEISGRHDTRDSPLVPNSGHSVRLALQWGDQVLGSELDFLRARYRQSHYVPLSGRDTVLALALRSGVIVPTHDTIDIPIQELFFNGGENTVRSFRQDELGPLDPNGQPLGGEAFTVFSAEVRQKLLGNLSGAVFFDWGNVAANYEDYFDFDDFRPGVGIGLRYLLPIGPLRIDAGWNPTAGPAEDDVVVHFSVGLPF